LRERNGWCRRDKSYDGQLAKWHILTSSFVSLR
jgi:hypothetical protein